MNIDGCRYNERLNAKTEGSERLTYTGILGKIQIKPSSGHAAGGRRSGQTQ
jgi:hypothetical protein